MSRDSASILQNKDKIQDLKGIRFHRVIDNEVMKLSADDLWIQLNYHLIHFVDFLPVANWQTHYSDPLLQIFVQLSEFLDEMGQRQAKVDFPIPSSKFTTCPRDTFHWLQALKIGSYFFENEARNKIYS